MSTPPLIFHSGGPQPSQSIQTRKPEVSYNALGIAPPSPLHLTLDDSLFVKIFAPTIALPFTVNIELRVLTPQGEIKPTRQPVLVNASTVTLPFGIDEGFILSAGASLAAGATANRGQVFCQLLVIRNILTDPLVLWTLLSEYITTNFRPSWPNGAIRGPLEGNGNLRSITGSSPPVGSDFAETVPAAVRWLVRSCEARLTTSAAAGNREVSLKVGDASGQAFYLGPSGFQQAPSLSRNYAFARGIQTISAALAIQSSLVFPDVFLPAAWTFNSFTTGLDAVADQWALIHFEVEEWCDI